MVADLGDRSLGSLDGGKSQPTSTTPTTSGTSTSPPTPGADSSAPVPSYCNGITLYASFDSKLTGDVGGQSTQTTGGVSQVPQGKFGGALSLVHDPANTTDGAALYFISQNGGASPWPEDVGSLAVWYRQAPGTAWGANPLAPVLYRPVATLPPAPLATAGLAFYLFDDADRSAGLYEMVTDPQNPQKAILTTDIDSQLPFLRGDFNHYFTAWQKNAAPTAYFAVNGGLGIRTDGTAAAAPTPGAGELHSPFKGYTSAPWASQGPAVGVRLGGVGTNTPDGLFDDLVIWNRIVSFDELAALYKATTSVGDTCKLH
jgi:hypothetical protein